MSTEPILTLLGHTNEVNSIAFSPDGRVITSASDDNTIVMWDTVTGNAIGQPLRQNSSVMGVAFSPDNKRIVSDLDHQTLQIWDAVTGNVLGSPLTGHTDWIRCVAFSPDGQRIVSGSDDQSVRIWDGMTGEAVGPILEGHSSGVYGIAWSPDGRRIVSGSLDKTIRIWDSMTGKEIGSPLEGHTEGVTCVAVSPDGKRIVSGSWDKAVRMWNAAIGKAIGPPLQEHTGTVYGVAFSPDGKFIVSGSYDKTMRVWDGETGEAIGSPIRIHDDVIRCLAFSPDGNRIASGSRDKTIKLWDSATVGAALYVKLFTIKIDDDDPSILANVSNAVAQCKQGEVGAAMRQFDLAIAVSSSLPKCAPLVCPILVIEAIALFEAGSEETGIARVDDIIRLSAKNAGFQMIKAYMLNKVAEKAFERGQYDRAVEILSQAISNNDLSRTMDIYYKCRAYIPADQGLSLITTLFGWEFDTLRYKSKQTLCEALYRIGRSQDALDAAENMGKELDGDEQAKYKEWSAAFKQDCAKAWSAKDDHVKPEDLNG